MGCPFRHDCIFYPPEGRPVIRLLIAAYPERLFVEVPSDHATHAERYLRAARDKAAAHGLLLAPTGVVNRCGTSSQEWQMHEVTVRPCATDDEARVVYRTIMQNVLEHSLPLIVDSGGGDEWEGEV